MLLAGGGCSFALSGPDRSLPRSQEPTCSIDKTAVLGDSLLATAAGITTLAVGADSAGAAVIPAVIGAVLIGAAIHGNNTVNECRAAKAEYVASLQALPTPPIAAEADADRAALVSPVPIAPAQIVPAAVVAAPIVPAPAAAPAATPAGPPVATAPAWSAFWKEVR